MTAIDWKSIITGAINADTTISAKAPAEARNAPPNCLRSDRCVQTRTRLSKLRQQQQTHGGDENPDGEHGILGRPGRKQRIVDGFCESHSAADPRLSAYAQSARCGRVLWPS